MALLHKYTLVCDDIRREDNGKVLIIGLYTPGITLPQFPFRMPKLVFFSYFEATAIGKWELTVRFSHATTGALVGPEGKAKIDLVGFKGATAPVVLPLSIPNIQFQMPGDYLLTVTGPDFEGLSVTVPVMQRAATSVH